MCVDLENVDGSTKSESLTIGNKHPAGNPSGNVDEKYFPIGNKNYSPASEFGMARKKYDNYKNKESDSQTRFIPTNRGYVRNVQESLCPMSEVNDVVSPSNLSMRNCNESFDDYLLDRVTISPSVRVENTPTYDVEKLYTEKELPPHSIEKDIPPCNTEKEFPNNPINIYPGLGTPNSNDHIFSSRIRTYHHIPAYKTLHHPSTSYHYVNPSLPANVYNNVSLSFISQIDEYTDAVLLKIPDVDLKSHFEKFDLLKSGHVYCDVLVLVFFRVNVMQLLGVLDLALLIYRFDYLFLVYALGRVSRGQVKSLF